MKTISVNCGDWHLGWGYGGRDKVGKLSTSDGKEFEWKGHSQGRHGRKWNHGAFVRFTIGPEGVITELSREGSIPGYESLREGVKDLQTKLQKA